METSKSHCYIGRLALLLGLTALLTGCAQISPAIQTAGDILNAYAREFTKTPATENTTNAYDQSVYTNSSELSCWNDQGVVPPGCEGSRGAATSDSGGGCQAREPGSTCQ